MLELYFFTSNDLVSTCHESNRNILESVELDMANSLFIQFLLIFFFHFSYCAAERIHVCLCHVVHISLNS